MNIVWVNEYRCWGIVKRRSSNYVVVEYSHDGIDYEEMLDLDDITEPNEMGIDYETEA